MAGGWFNCTVSLAGPAEDGEIYVALTDTAGGFGESWFRAVSNMRKEILATALSAIAGRGAVLVALEDTTEYSVIDRFYIIK